MPSIITPPQSTTEITQITTQNIYHGTKQSNETHTQNKHTNHNNINQNYNTIIENS